MEGSKECSTAIQQYNSSSFHVLLSKIWKQKTLFIFLLPAIVFTLVFNYRPMYGVIMAFQKYDIFKGLSGSEFIGLENFRDFLKEPDFYNALKNTLGINLISLALAFPLPILFAILINEISGDRFKKVAQSITYLPHFISWVVIAGLFYKMLDQDSGIINIIMEKLGMERVGFFRESSYFWGIMIFAVIWKEVGWNSILYLSAIMGIDTQLYEAAEVDGANRFEKIWYITIPSITPTIILLFIMTLGTFVSAGGGAGGTMAPTFEALLAFRNPMVSTSSDVIDVYSYISGIQQGYYSYAAAIGLTQSVASLIIIFGSNKLIKKLSGHSLF